MEKHKQIECEAPGAALNSALTNPPAKTFCQGWDAAEDGASFTHQHGPEWASGWIAYHWWKPDDGRHSYARH